MQIQSLATISITQLVQTFNQSFADYFIPIQFTVATLESKIKSENIFLEHSVGVFVREQLVAFVLIGIDSKNNQLYSYNAGTGVIPDFRGQHLTEKMYAYLLPILKKNSIQNHYLEVITQNTKALRIYQKIGYQISRKVSCFKGVIQPPNSVLNYKIFEFEWGNNTFFETFWDHQPTYQNTSASINRDKETHSFIGIFSEIGLLGYLIFAKANLRVKQFGIDKNFRNQGLGHHLFYEVQKTNFDQPVSLINIDNNDSHSIAFLEKIGLTKTVEQYEMMLQT